MKKRKIGLFDLMLCLLLRFPDSAAEKTKEGCEKRIVQKKEGPGVSYKTLRSFYGVPGYAKYNFCVFRAGKSAEILI